MSKRIVFGRRLYSAGGDVRANCWKIEMRADGIYIRHRYSRQVWHIPFKWLLKFCVKQFELFPGPNENVVESLKERTLSGVSQGQLVSGEPGSGSVHAGGEQQAASVQERRDRVDTSIVRLQSVAQTDTLKDALKESGLSWADDPVVAGDAPATVPGTGGKPGGA